MDRDLGRARAFYDLAARRFRSVPSLNAAFAQWREVFHCENLQRHKSFNRLTKQTLMQTIQYFPFNACVTNLIVSQTDRKSTVRTNFDLQLWTCTTISWPFSNKLILIFLEQFFNNFCYRISIILSVCTSSKSSRWTFRRGWSRIWNI